MSFVLREVVQYVEKTFQGEAFEPGLPVTLLRFKRCKVGCPWCDTKRLMSQPGFEVKIFDVINTARRVGALLITGGEPMLYMNEILSLVTMLNAPAPNTPRAMPHPMVAPATPHFGGAAQVKVFIETTLYNPDLTDDQVEAFLNSLQSLGGGRLLLNVSPKLKTIKEKEDLYMNVLRHPFVRFKFVLAGSEEEQVETLAFLTKLVEKIPEPLRPEKFSLMPQGKTAEEVLRNTPSVLSIAKDLNVTFSPRLHIIHSFE